jgi:hypothetical protein
MPATCKVVGLWLHFYAIIGFFMLLLVRAYFYVVSQEATTMRKHIFLCHIVRAVATIFLCCIPRKQASTTIIQTSQGTSCKGYDDMAHATVKYLICYHLQG